MYKKTHGYTIEILFSAYDDKESRIVDYVSEDCVRHIVNEILVYKDIELIKDAVEEKNKYFSDLGNELLEIFTVSVQVGTPGDNNKRIKNKIVFHFYFKKDVLNDLVSSFSSNSIYNILKQRNTQIRFDI